MRGGIQLVAGPYHRRSEPFFSLTAFNIFRIVKWVQSFFDKSEYRAPPPHMYQFLLYFYESSKTTHANTEVRFAGQSCVAPVSTTSPRPWVNFTNRNNRRLLLNLHATRQATCSAISRSTWFHWSRWRMLRGSTFCVSSSALLTWGDMVHAHYSLSMPFGAEIIIESPRPSACFNRSGLALGQFANWIKLWSAFKSFSIREPILWSLPLTFLFRYLSHMTSSALICGIFCLSANLAKRGFAFDIPNRRE